MMRPQVLDCVQVVRDLFGSDGGGFYCVRVRCLERNKGTPLHWNDRDPTEHCVDTRLVATKNLTCAGRLILAQAGRRRDDRCTLCLVLPVGTGYNWYVSLLVL